MDQQTEAVAEAMLSLACLGTSLGARQVLELAGYVGGLPGTWAADDRCWIA